MGKVYRVKRGDDGLSLRLGERQRQMMRAEKKRARAHKMTGAHTTMPIEDMAMVRRWLAVAKEHDARRNRGGVSWYALLLLGFNTGLRIGDLCALRVGDVRGRERVCIVAEKTGKTTDIPLQAAARQAIDAALRGLEENDFALKSRQRKRATGAKTAISRQRCYAIIKEIARRAGFREHVGCHTMRKTFAWNYYKTCGDLAELQKVLNHSSQEATIHYLGLDRKKIEDTVNRMPVMV